MVAVATKNNNISARSFRSLAKSSPLRSPPPPAASSMRTCLQREAWPRLSILRPLLPKQARSNVDPFLASISES